MQIFYTPDIAESSELPEEEARHALRVLRLGEGAELLLTDGRGFFYKAILRTATPKHCEVQITGRFEQPPLWNFHLHVAVAPTKNIDRMEWFCEKATEVGINAITFLNCRFSERREVHASRMKKILAAAMKQSGKATLPYLADGTVPFSTFVRQPFSGHTFIAHCRGEEERLPLAHACPPGADALILIGPEGDFSPEEIGEALEQGFTPVTLGQSRLRTETAALAACHTLHVLNSLAGLP
jgi:16S rRNA (uracil1498-N3)-methyltransferase